MCNLSVSVIIKTLFPFSYWSMIKAEISSFKWNYDYNICDPAFLMLICHSASLERNYFHWRLFSGLDSKVWLCALFFFYRVEKFSWSVSEREKKKDQSEMFWHVPEKRPPYSLIGFMFFSCLMINASLVHWHKSERRMVLTLDVIWKDFMWAFQCILFFCPLFIMFFWSQESSCVPLGEYFSWMFLTEFKQFV